MSAVALTGLVIGAVLGAMARHARFCTLGAIADALTRSDERRLRAWVLGVAVALAGTQLLDGAGFIDLDRSIHLAGGIGWLGAVLGGAAFGFGMALVGTCGFGSLIRLGDGDLRALVTFVTIAVTGYATISGPLAYPRTMLIEAADLPLPPDLAALVALPFGVEPHRLRPMLAALIVTLLLAYCLSDQSFRRSRRDIAAGLAVGGCVTLGWAATGILGADSFDPAPLVSLTFVRPLGDSLLHVMLMSGSRLDFGVASVLGVVLGAAGVSRAEGRRRLEGFDGAREMRRHLAGGALMGVGGVTALGCTIGQGVTGLSTLAVASLLAVAGIVAGAVVGLRYLEEGSLSGALRLILGLPAGGPSVTAAGRPNPGAAARPARPHPKAPAPPRRSA